MIALVIILFIIILFLLTPLGADASYIGGALTLAVKAGPLKIRLFPKKPGKEKPPKPDGQEKKDKKKKAKTKVPKQKLTISDISEIIKLGLNTLGRFRKSLSVDIFMLSVNVSADDPFDAVMRYGYINAALGALISLAHRSFKVRDESISVGLDISDGKTSADVRLVVTIQVWELFHIAFCAAYGFLLWQRKRKKRAKAVISADTQSEKGQ